MKKVFLLNLLILQFSSSESQVQSITVPLLYSQNCEISLLNEVVTLSEDKRSERYKGIGNSFKDFSIKVFPIDNANWIYQKYLSKEINDSMFNWAKEAFRFSEKDFNKDVIPEISILFGETHNFGRVIIPDLNNNKDFSDDKQYSESMFMSAAPLRIQNLQSIINGKKFFGSAWIISEFKMCDEVVDESNKWPLCLRIGTQRIIKFKIFNEEIKLLITNNISKGLKFDSKSISIYPYEITSQKTQNILPVPYKISDTIYSDNFYVIVDKVDTAGRYVRVKYARHKIKGKNGFNKGFYIPDFNSFNNLTRKNINLKAFKGKYLLVYFGGSWCGPCKEIFPSYRQLYDSIQDCDFKDSVFFVPISVERTENYIANKNEIFPTTKNWINVLEYFDSAEPLFKKLHISDYPTFILISPSGRILERVSGSKNFDLIKRRLLYSFSE